MRRFSEEMDRLFGDVFADFGTARRRLARREGHGFGFPQGEWAPPIEVFERDDRFVVRAELPGLSKDDVKVEVTGDLLTIGGERREEREETREGYRHSERRYIEITMPAPQRVDRGRRIEIQGA